MRYRDAAKLHNEDEIIIKGCGTIKTIMEIEIGEKTVMVVTTDCCQYTHKEFM